MMQKTFDSQMDCKERKLVNPKGNQPWVFIGRTNVEAPILWSPDSKSWLIGKDSDVGKDWRQEENEAAEEEMVGWYHQLNGHEFEQTPGDSGGQRSLVCYSPLGHKVRQNLVTEQQQYKIKPGITFPKPKPKGVKP